MAGYSGGRKLIAPGLAHADTIRTFHNHAFMSNPAAANCNLQQNPLHEEQLQIVKMIGGAYALNTVIDEHRNLSMVNFGEIAASHQDAVSFIQRYCRVAVPRRFRTVVTSAAGYPLDKTYYQSVKGMVGAIDILEPGGNLIIVSECSEGIGSEEYVLAQKRLTERGPMGFLQSIQEKPLADIDEWQTQMQTKAMAEGQIYLYSQLAPDRAALTGVKIIDSVDEAVRQSLDETGCRSVAVIPEGPYVIPYVENELA
jgi:nickel-dependent lactate racemase